MSRSSRAPNDLDDTDVPPARITRQSLREAVRLAGYLRPYWLPFLLAMVSLALGSALALAFPHVTGLLIDALNRPAAAEPASWWRSVDGVAVTLLLILTVQAVF